MKLLLITSALWLSFACSPELSVQQRKPFLNKNGKIVSVLSDPRTGVVQGITGLSETIKNYGLSLGQLDESSVEIMARTLIDDYANPLGLDSKQIRKWSIDGGGGSWYIRFEQVVNDVPVEDSRITFHIGKWGDISDVVTKIYPNVAISTEPKITREKALQIARREFSGNEITDDISPRNLVIFVEETDHSLLYHLAWRIILDGGTQTNRFYVSALDGKILKVEGLQVTNSPGKLEPPH